MERINEQKREELTQEQIQLFEKIKKEVMNKKIQIVNGAFGDVPNCDAIVEEVIRPKEGGTLTKFYGCSYYFKGWPEKSIVNHIDIGKSLLSAIPREIILKSFIFKSALVIMYIFAKKRLIHYLRVFFSNIYQQRLVMRINIPIIRYNTVISELRRAMDKVLIQMSDETGYQFEEGYNRTSGKFLLHTEDDRMNGKREYWELIANISEFAYLFLEFDNAYRFRLQDILGELDKENVKKSVVSEITRLFKIALEREDPAHAQNRIKAIKKIIIPLLWLSSKNRLFLKRFLLELDIDKVKLDESDWYFCLNRIGYKFRGLTYQDRFDIKRKIDKDKHHVLFNVNYLPKPE